MKKSEDKYSVGTEQEKSGKRRKEAHIGRRLLSVLLVTAMLSTLLPPIFRGKGVKAETATFLQWSAVSLGYHYSAAITTNGDLYCWGENGDGQVGNGTTVTQTTPVKVLGNVSVVSLGGYYSAAITTNGDLYCWGLNNYGQVGNGTTINQTAPVKVLGNVSAVSLGYYHSAAITTNGDLYCWGCNKYGGVGDGTTATQTTPVKVLGNVSAVSLGYYHSVAITTNGDLYCWGLNEHGQVGNGTTVTQKTPVKVLGNVSVVSLGIDHSAALTTNGDLYCWGENGDGQVGNGTTIDQKTPVKVLGNVSAVFLEDYYSAALTTNGDLYCWGLNNHGQVGNGTTVTQTTPVKVLGNVSAVSLRLAQSAALTTNGDLYCWGLNNYGQVGNGTTVTQTIPVKVLDNVSAVSFGASQGAALTTNDDLYCWGNNKYGQVGNGTTTDQRTPTKVLVKNNNSDSNAEEEKKFIETHLNYIGNNENNTYHYLLNYCDLSKIALRDYSELKDTYDKWRLLRGSIFDNPYEVALADLIISEESVNSQMDSFTVNLYSKQQSVINNVMKLINGKVDLTSDQKSKIEKLFSERKFDDDTTYQLCADILSNYVSEDELKTLFQTYDTSSKFMGLLGDGKKIVDSVVDVINYASILQAYNETSDEFKEVLTLIDYYCQGENSALDYAITQYLLAADTPDINSQIIKKVVGNSIDVGKDLFEETILSKARNFMIENMDLSNVAEAKATQLLAVIEGIKIGHSLGTTIDNILFNTDNVADAYITVYADCKLAYYMKLALNDYATNLTKNQTLRNAELFCEAYNMYKHIQINVAENMIRYFASNELSLIDKIFKSSAYEAAVYQWQILKLNWDNAKCHNESVTYTNTKNITIACPVDIEIKDNSNSLILKVENNIVTYNCGKAIVTIRNNIKYITVPDDSYSVNIIATGIGKMSYSITNFNYLEPTETVNYENIQLENGKTYTGAITEGKKLSVEENALVSNGKIVESTSSAFGKNEKIDVNYIKLDKESVELAVGSTEKLKAEILPVNASVKTVTWYSANPNIATVDKYGTLTAIAEGSTVIYCSTLDGTVTSECKIIIKTLDNNIDNTDTGNQDTGNGTGNNDDMTVFYQEGTGNNDDTTMFHQEGTVLTDADGNIYRVTKAGAKGGTVAFVKPAEGKESIIAIPDVITVDGIMYQVTSIAARAFKGNKKVTKVTIGVNIESIGKQAFYRCKNLKKIIIKTTKLTVKKVGSRAFKKIHAKAVVKVPKNKKKTYKKLLKKKGLTGKKQKVK